MCKVNNLRVNLKPFKPYSAFLVTSFQGLKGFNNEAILR